MKYSKIENLIILSLSSKHTTENMTFTLSNIRRHDRGRLTVVFTSTKVYHHWCLLVGCPVLDKCT